MKTIFIKFLLIFGCTTCIASQYVYVNMHYCKDQITLYKNGRSDWYNCEQEETYYGHYWQENDSLFVETFCSSYCYEDHKCFIPRIDVFTIQSDTLFHIGYHKFLNNSQCYSDTLYSFQSPFIYILQK